jgi:hypothetical protein
VFEKKVLRKIFETEREEVTGEWRRLHNEELSDLYSSPKCYLDDKIENEVDRACST